MWPFRRKPAPPPVAEEIASARNGRDITRGYVDGLPLLEPTDPVLRFRDQRTYDEILRDDQVKATLDQRRQAVVAREWVVEPGGDRPIDISAADDLRLQLTKIQWDRACERMLYGTFYGFAAGECMWGHRDGKVVLEDIRVRRQRRFGFAPDGSLRLLTTSQPTGESVPDRKFWVWNTGGESDDDPYGLGLAHWLYWPTLFKRGGVKFWMIFLEKFGQPTAVGKYRPNASAEEKRRLLEAVGAIQTDAGMILPETMLVELLEAARSGTADYEVLCTRMDKAISKVVLGQTMTTDDGASLSQSQVHWDVRQGLVKADADALCASFNAGPAAWLTDWNWPGAATPQVWRTFPDDASLRGRAETEALIAQMGWRPTKKHVTDTYGGEWEELPSSPDQGGGWPAPTMPTAPGRDALDDVATEKAADTALNGAQVSSLVAIVSAVAAGEIPRDAAVTIIGRSFQVDDATAERMLGNAGRGFRPASQTAFAERATEPGIDGVVRELGRAAAPTTTQWIERVRDLANEVESLEELESRLLDIYGELDVDGLGTVLEQALTLADLRGRNEVPNA